jgi:hypothetical protein
MEMDAEREKEIKLAFARRLGLDPLEITNVECEISTNSHVQIIYTGFKQMRLNDFMKLWNEIGEETK